MPLLPLLPPPTATCLPENGPAAAITGIVAECSPCSYPAAHPLAHLARLPAGEPAAEAVLLHLPSGWRREAAAVVVEKGAAAEGALPSNVATAEVGGVVDGARLRREGVFVCPATGLRFASGADALAHLAACAGANPKSDPGNTPTPVIGRHPNPAGSSGHVADGADCGAAGEVDQTPSLALIRAAGGPAGAPAGAPPLAPTNYLPGPAFKRTLSGTVLVSQGSAHLAYIADKSTASEAVAADTAGVAMAPAAVGRVLAGEDGHTEELQMGALLTLAAASELAAEEEEQGVGSRLGSVALASTARTAAAASAGAGAAAAACARLPAQTKEPDLARPERATVAAPELRLVGSVTDMVALPAAAAAPKPGSAALKRGAAPWLVQKPHATTRKGGCGTLRGPSEGMGPPAGVPPATWTRPAFTGFPGPVAASVASWHLAGGVNSGSAADAGSSNPNPTLAVRSAAAHSAAHGLPGGLFKTRSEPAKQLLAYADDARACVHFVPEALPQENATPSVLPGGVSGPGEVVARRGSDACLGADGVSEASAHARIPGCSGGGGKVNPTGNPDPSASPPSAPAALGAGARSGVPGIGFGPGLGSVAEEGAGLPCALAGGGWAPRRPLGRAVSDPSVLREGLAGCCGGGGDHGLQRLPASTSLVSWQARLPAEKHACARCIKK